MRKRTVRLCLRLRLPRRELLWSLSCCCRVLGCARLLTSGLGRLRYSCPFWDSLGSSNDRGLGCKWAWMECAGRLSKSKNARDEHGWRSRSVTRVNVTFACSRVCHPWPVYGAFRVKGQTSTANAASLFIAPKMREEIRLYYPETRQSRCGGCCTREENVGTIVVAPGAFRRVASASFSDRRAPGYRFRCRPESFDNRRATSPARSSAREGSGSRSGCTIRIVPPRHKDSPAR